jgi:NADP-dependent 3-hydroxy acid dehydrogenase YdfG
MYVSSTDNPAMPIPNSRRPVLDNNPKLRLPSTTDPPGDANPPVQKTWLIFGATGHIGRSLVKAALSHGDNVTAVGRTMENSMEQMQGWHKRCLGLLCDVRVRNTVEEVLQASIKRWGKLDIIVKYAGGTSPRSMAKC